MCNSASGGQQPPIGTSKVTGTVRDSWELGFVGVEVATFDQSQVPTALIDQGVFVEVA
jgi:hypothetical protein